ncbi:MAG: ABC transporter permease [Flavisolibacter sp.]|jgi:heme exporter protein C|nr:ABC transporter permease [Flavisolibacter sp.]
MNKSWWKIISVLLLVYTIIAGFGLLWKNDVPRLPALQETIRNLYFHVCMWFGMMILFTASVFHAIKYLQNNNLRSDISSRAFAGVGILFGLLGYATGAIWLSYTWVDPNQPAYESFGAIAKDPKLIGAAIALLIYFAYLVLRGSIQDIDKRARIGAVYNIFAFAFLFPAIWIIPRLLPSLHPGGEGSEGNPALNYKDMAPKMRFVFYPAIIGWTLLGVWIVSIKVRLELYKERIILTQWIKK